MGIPSAKEVTEGSAPWFKISYIAKSATATTKKHRDCAVLKFLDLSQFDILFAGAVTKVSTISFNHQYVFYKNMSLFRSAESIS